MNWELLIMEFIKLLLTTKLGKPKADYVFNLLNAKTPEEELAIFKAHGDLISGAAAVAK